MDSQGAIDNAIKDTPELQLLNSDEISSFLEEGKSLLIIGVDCSNDCTNESILSGAETINHEEIAHGINAISDEKKGTIQEHKDYQNDGSYTSPTSKEIRTNPKFKDTEARKQFKELDKIINNEK